MSTTRDKIYISKDDMIQSLYYKLSKEDKSDSPTKPFRTMKDVFLAAAVLGYLNNNFEELSSGKKDIFGWGTLLNDEHALTALRTLALAKTKDPNVLLDDDKLATIAEGYANAGIQILAKRIINTDMDELEEAAIYMAEILESIETLEQE